MANSAERLGYLRSYLGKLTADLAAEGRFAAGGADRIEAAVHAVLNGGSAVAKQLAEDLREIGSQMTPVIGVALENAAANAARAAASHVATTIGDLFSGKARAKKEQAKKEQKHAGKALMIAAAKMRSK